MDQIVTYLFEDLIMKGPRFLGFFQSKDKADICQQLTQVASTHWQIAYSECDVIVNNYVNSFSVLFVFLFKMYCLIGTVSIIFTGVKNVVIYRNSLLYHHVPVAALREKQG